MKILVANRGEIACRVLRGLRAMGIPSVAIHSEVDRDAPFVWLADEAVPLGENSSYLDIPRILEIVKETGATAIHPGYGFLSENASFAEACAKAGIVFIGPSPEAIRSFGDKREASTLAKKNDVPVIPGAQAVDTVDEARAAAAEVGYPILVKAAAGGGGKGMRQVTKDEELQSAFDGAKREALAAFGDDRLLVEKYIFPARHVEVQLLGDGTKAIALGERECSLQRRYQKIVEESPSPGITEETRKGLCDTAVRLAESVGYSGAGTVEFLVGPDQSFYFLEVNTRLQVEHPVTELRFGVDLVRAQVRIAHGESVEEAVGSPTPRGAAIEVRLNAEMPYQGFLPGSGDVLMLQWPEGPGVRVDAGVAEGQAITSDYDPMLAKIIAWGEDREQARRRIIGALRELVVLGLPTNQTFLCEVLEKDFFIEGETFTTTIEKETWEAPDVPEFAQALADRLSQATSATTSSGGLGDTHSPWRRLGAFRLGG